MTNEQLRLEALKLAIAVATNVPNVNKSDKAIVTRTQVYFDLLRERDGTLEDSLRQLMREE